MSNVGGASRVSADADDMSANAAGAGMRLYGAGSAALGASAQVHMEISMSLLRRYKHQPISLFCFQSLGRSKIEMGCAAQ